MSQVSAGKGTAPVAFYDTAGKIIHHSRLCGLEAHSFARHSARFGRCVDLRGGERASASDWYGSLVCGDFTDFGLPEEAAILAEDIKAHVRIPVIGVVGNHDFESGKIAEVQSIIEEAEVSFLDGETAEVRGVGFAGVCGFGGGFGHQMLNAWGEPLIKAFVQEAIDHSLRLEKALTRLKTEKRVVLLHYSPIRDTVQGENPELFPFLGASRFEATIDRFEISAVFHRHAHHGTHQGKTAKNVQVFIIM
jgi:uncharacterized protein